MKRFINRFVKDESGITALETAIILIAFVVVAAVFAFTVLSTGTFLTERSKEAAYSGLQEVRGSMELKGSVIAKDTTAAPGDGVVEEIYLNLATVAGGASVDLSDGSGTSPAKIQIVYHDKNNNDILTAGTDWVVDSCASCTGAAGAQILGSGALATLKITPPNNALLVANGRFSVEIKPPTGGVMLIERTLPAEITAVTDLH